MLNKCFNKWNLGENKHKFGNSSQKLKQAESKELKYDAFPIYSYSQSTNIIDEVN